MKVLCAHEQGFHPPEVVRRAGTKYHGGSLPFAFHDVTACVLQLVVLCMCKCMCSAGTGASLGLDLVCPASPCAGHV